MLPFGRQRPQFVALSKHVPLKVYEQLLVSTPLGEAVAVIFHCVVATRRADSVSSRSPLVGRLVFFAQCLNTLFC